MRSSGPFPLLLCCSGAICIALSSFLSAAERIPLAVGEDVFGGSFDFSASGDLIGISRDGTVSIVDSDTGELLRRVELDVAVDGAAFSREGSSVAVFSRRERINRLSVWSCDTWERTPLKSLTLPDATHVITMAYTPSGDKLVATTIGRKTKHAIHVWNTTTGNEIAVLAEDHNLQIARFSPDGQWLAASGNYGAQKGKGQGALFLWNAEQFDEPAVLGSNGVNHNFAFSPDGKFLAVHTYYPTERELREPSGLLSRGDVALWDLETRSRRAVLSGFRGSVVLSFSVDSQLLAASGIVPTGMWSQTPGELVQVWDLQSGQRTVIERNSHAASVKFSPRGNYLLSSFATPTSGFRLRDPTGRVVETIRQGQPRDVIGRMVFSPSGDRLAVAISQSLSGEDRFCLWNLNATSSQSDQQ